MISPITSMRNAFRLDGKNAVITGGNRGLGLGIALAMAEQGANVAILCRDKQKAAEASPQAQRNCAGNGPGSRGSGQAHPLERTASGRPPDRTLHKAVVPLQRREAPQCARTPPRTLPRLSCPRTCHSGTTGIQPF